MAIYHLKTKPIAKGKSLAKSKYNMREGKYAEREDKLIYREAGNLPSWAEGDHKKFWRAADRYERKGRGDSPGRAGREILLALPIELSPQQNIELTQAFTEYIVKDKHPYSLGIHEGYGGNPHAHLLFSERQVDDIERDRKRFFKQSNHKHPEKGGALKSREVSKKGWLEEARREWANHTNYWLEKYGHDARIDHRTLKEQGIDREPKERISLDVISMERRGIATEKMQILDEHNEHIRSISEQLSNVEIDIEVWREIRDEAQQDKEKEQQDLERSRNQDRGL